MAAYVNVQNMRFEDHFKLTIDVPEELYDYKIIKIILQPLVENAILHGIREKSSESGEITIRAGLEDGVITILLKTTGSEFQRRSWGHSLPAGKRIPAMVYGIFMKESSFLTERSTAFATRAGRISAQRYLLHFRRCCK